MITFTTEKRHEGRVNAFVVSPLMYARREGSGGTDTEELTDVGDCREPSQGENPKMRNWERENAVQRARSWLSPQLDIASLWRCLATQTIIAGRWSDGERIWSRESRSSRVLEETLYRLQSTGSRVPFREKRF